MITLSSFALSILGKDGNLWCSCLLLCHDYKWKTVWYDNCFEICTTFSCIAFESCSITWWNVDWCGIHLFPLWWKITTTQYPVMNCNWGWRFIVRVCCISVDVIISTVVRVVLSIIVICYSLLLFCQLFCEVWTILRDVMIFTKSLHNFLILLYMRGWSHFRVLRFPF